MMEDYKAVHEGQAAFYRQERGLIAVWGKESLQFLNGMITNDIKKANEESTLKAAFANAQGRLMTLVRVKRRGDKFLFETEKIRHGWLLEHLSRFTLAGNFFVEDLTDKYEFFSTFNLEVAGDGLLSFDSNFGKDFFVEKERVEDFIEKLSREYEALEVSDDTFEMLRIEAGVPKYGVDMDETTVVPELGIDDLISYNKGCYIGQEIIARIHFRGHVAKQLKGLVFDTAVSIQPRSELKSEDGKNAGYLTSSVFSQHFGTTIALGYVRYDYLAEGTRLHVGEVTASVRNLPMVDFAKRLEKVR